MRALNTDDLRGVREKFGLSWGAVEAYAGAADSEHNQEVATVRDFFTNPGYTGTLGDYMWPKVLDELE